MFTRLQIFLQTLLDEKTLEMHIRHQAWQGSKTSLDWRDGDGPG